MTTQALTSYIQHRDTSGTLQELDEFLNLAA